jgi:hypothetical protein
MLLLWPPFGLLSDAKCLRASSHLSGRLKKNISEQQLNDLRAKSKYWLQGLKPRKEAWLMAGMKPRPSKSLLEPQNRTSAAKAALIRAIDVVAKATTYKDNRVARCRLFPCERGVKRR